jgi:hypothetical protein
MIVPRRATALRGSNELNRARVSRAEVDSQNLIRKREAKTSSADQSASPTPADAP